jgi:hypothetical protein
MLIGLLYMATAPSHGGRLRIWLNTAHIANSLCAFVTLVGIQGALTGALAQAWLSASGSLLAMATAATLTEVIIMVGFALRRRDKARGRNQLEPPE